MPRHSWRPELWKLQLEPWELNLSELPDGGASVLDLPDGEGPAPLLVNIHPYPGGTAYPSVIMGSTGAQGAAVYWRTDAGPALVLDARRPSIEANLCRWLGWRLHGFVMRGPLTFEREDYHGLQSKRLVGQGWCLLAGSHPVGIWPVQSSPVAGIDDRTAALVALIKHYAADTAGQAPGAAASEGAPANPPRFVRLPDGSAVDPAQVVGWRDAGPDATDLYLANGEHLSVYVGSSMMAKLLGATS